MLALWHEKTQAHDTHELLGSRVIRAYECPERIDVIVQQLKWSGHKLLRPEINRAILSADAVEGDGEGDEQDGDPPTELLQKMLARHHHEDYLHHIRTAHKRWVAEGIISRSESVIPECFRLDPARG